MKKNSVILAAIGAAMLLLRRRQVSGIGKVRRNIFREISWLQEHDVPLGRDYNHLDWSQQNDVARMCTYAKYRQPEASKRNGESLAESYYKSLSRQYLKLVNPAIGRIQYPHTTSVIRNSRGDVVLTYNDYDPETTLAQFDILLQGVLVSVACSDMIFDDIEQQFIQNIAVHGDLFDYIRTDSNGEVDLTWEDFAGAETKGQLSLVSILPQVLADQCESFVLPLAAVDFSYSQYGNLPTTPGDFLRSIENDMITIATLLAFVDDEGEPVEVNAAAEMIYALVERHWKGLIEA